MIWGLSDRFVGEVIEFYGSREQAERALQAVLDDEPQWKGMIEIVPVPRPARPHWAPRGKLVCLPRCRPL